jgi:hypothetical protein
MPSNDFTIIFEKLNADAQPVAESAEGQGGAAILSDAYMVELDELAELGRVAAEIAEPEPMSFTTT